MQKLRKGFFVLLLLTSCSGLEQSQQEALRRNNAKGEFILRSQEEYHFATETPKQIPRAPYPWEKKP